MRLGLIADVHANAAALEAVLADARGVDAWLCAGDVVGYHPDVNTVCGRLRAIGACVVLGNHDAYVTGALVPDARRREASRTDWTRAHIAPGHLAWLAALPREAGWEIDGLRIRLRHASPWDLETSLDSRAPALARVAIGPDEVLVVGHTHQPMIVARPDGGRIVNPGSVGQPRDGSAAAAYAVLDTGTREMELRRVAWDVTVLQQRLRCLGWEASTIDVLGRAPSAGVEPLEAATR